MLASLAPMLRADSIKVCCFNTRVLPRTSRANAGMLKIDTATMTLPMPLPKLLKMVLTHLWVVAILFLVLTNSIWATKYLTSQQLVVRFLSTSKAKFFLALKLSADTNLTLQRVTPSSPSEYILLKESHIEVPFFYLGVPAKGQSLLLLYFYRISKSLIY